MHLRDHLSYGITQCYLPPSRSDSPDFTLAFTSTHFTIAWKVEGCVDLGTAVRVHNPCPRLYIAVVNTRQWWASILGPNAPQSSVLTTRWLRPVKQAATASLMKRKNRLAHSQNWLFWRVFSYFWCKIWRHILALQARFPIKATTFCFYLA